MFFTEASFLERPLSLARAYGFTAENSIIWGSFSLFAQGLLEVGRDGVPGDIDIECLDRRVFESYRMSCGCTVGNLNGFCGELVELGDGRCDSLTIDLTARWPIQNVSQRDVYERSTTKFGFRFASPYDVYHSMMQFRREKDAKKIESVGLTLGFNVESFSFKPEPQETMTLVHNNSTFVKGSEFYLPEHLAGNTRQKIRHTLALAA